MGSTPLKRLVKASAALVWSPASAQWSGAVLAPAQGQRSIFRDRSYQTGAAIDRNDSPLCFAQRERFQNCHGYFAPP